VVQRNRDAHAVVRAQTEGATDEIAIVQNVEMTERGALRRARGAARKLDVAGIGGLELIGQLLQAREILRPAESRDLIKVETAVGPFAPESDHAAQLRHPCRSQLVRI